MYVAKKLFNKVSLELFYLLIWIAYIIKHLNHLIFHDPIIYLAFQFFYSSFFPFLYPLIFSYSLLSPIDSLAEQGTPVISYLNKIKVIFIYIQFSITYFSDMTSSKLKVRSWRRSTNSIECFKAILNFLLNFFLLRKTLLAASRTF